MTHKTQPTAHAEITASISADLRRIHNAGAQPVEALLFEHKDGRHAVNPDTAGDPDWHRVGPVMVYGPAALQAAPRPPVAQERYRLLVRGVDTIQAMDEFLQDDAVTWQPDTNGIFVGMTYVGNVLLPARRAIKAGP